MAQHAETTPHEPLDDDGPFPMAVAIGIGFISGAVIVALALWPF